MVLVRQRSRRSATFTSTECRGAIRRIASLQSLRLASGPAHSMSALGRRPQCPGTRYALTRVSEFPLAIHPRELPVCRPRHRKSSVGKI